MDPKNPMNSLLDLSDPPEAGNPVEEPSAENPSGINKDIQEKISGLEKLTKDQQETIRQLTEQNKPIQEFFDKITGNPDVEKAKKEAQELAKKFDIDPAQATRLVIQQEVAPIKDAVAKQEATSKVSRAMAEIDKQFDVDWDKHYPQITEFLKKFDKNVKSADPKGSLLAAAKLAGALKKKEAAKPGAEAPLVMQSSRSGSRPAPEDHADKVNNRLSGIGKKKKDNVFKI